MIFRLIGESFRFAWDALRQNKLRTALSLLGITIGIFVVIALYLIVNISYLSLLPVARLEEINASGNGVAAIEAVKVFWGRNFSFAEYGFGQRYFNQSFQSCND